MTAVTGGVSEQHAKAAAAWLGQRRAEFLAFVRELVDHDSPSGDLETLSHAAAFLRTRVGGQASELAGEHGAHLVHRFGSGEGLGPVILAHYDTVWARGTARERPVTIDDTYIRGPGVLDMKASIAMAVFALRAVEEACGGFPVPVTLSLTPDEEIGNPSSRGELERLARAGSSVLVLEPSLPGGALKTRRKGIAHVHIDVTGVSAHPGLDSEGGANAAIEIAHLVLAAAELADFTQGTTVNVGIVRAGERRNVVPASGEIVLDVRSWSEREISRVIAVLEEMAPTIPGTTITVHGAIHRPPMSRRPDVLPLLTRAREAAATLGATLEEGEAGGGSEANLTASFAPTLDGLGPDGSGAHSISERVLIHSLFERTALLAALIAGER